MKLEYPMQLIGLSLDEIGSEFREREIHESGNKQTKHILISLVYF